MKAHPSKLSHLAAAMTAMLTMLACAFALAPLAFQPPEPPAETVLSAGEGALADTASATGTTSASETGHIAKPARQGASAPPAMTGADRKASARWSNGAEYRTGEVLVELTADGESANLKERLEQLDVLGPIDPNSLEDPSGWALLRLAAGVTAVDAIEALESSGIVESAQPNFVYHLLENSEARASATPSENNAARAAAPLAAGAFALQADDPNWHLKAIGAPAAWVYGQASRPTVAIVDTGCDVFHEDLKANVIAAYNVLDANDDVTDSVGHGTHIAGIVSAEVGNELGVSGVSDNAWILPIKVMEGDETETADILKGYRFAIDNAKRYNIRVINMSLGAEQAGLDPADWALLRTVDEAYFKGILSVFAAGNDDEIHSPYYCFPCDFAENGVGVISVGPDFAFACLPDFSSNFNKPNEKTKDLSAPGVDILSTVPGNDYETMTGTSMSAPVVAGVAALAFARNPDLDAGQAKSLLCTTAADISQPFDWDRATEGFDDYTGYGLVRADQAVAQAFGGYLSGPDALRQGATLQLGIPQAARAAYPGSWTWASDSPGIAQVDAASGIVQGVACGEAVISAANATTVLRKTIVVYDVGIDGAKRVAIGGKTRLVASANPVAAWTYSSSKPTVATVGSSNGIVKGVATGTTVITARLTACPTITVSQKVKVVKAANPMKPKAVAKTIKRTKLKAKARTISGCIKFTKKAKGKVSYSKVKKGSSKRLSINAKTGKIHVSKNTGPGTYRIKVKVKAAGTAKYKAATKTITVKIRVK